MLRNVIESMGSAWYVEVALILFVAVFVSVIVREALRPKREVGRIANLPLDSDDGN